jgi:prevent-host-death family protein
MRQLNLAEAKANLSRLVDQAAKGRGVIIAKSGIPMAKLVPIDEPKRRKFNLDALKGFCSDEAAKALEEPLPDEILEIMLRGPIESGEEK